MQIRVTRIDAAHCQMELDAQAEELTGAFDEALRRHRKDVRMSGFRPGNAPLHLVRRLYGKAIAFDVAEGTVLDAFRIEVLEQDVYAVVGRPTITELDHEMGGDLHAVVRFGVRPDVELQDLSGETLFRPKHVVEDEEVDEHFQRLCAGHAEIVPVEDEAITENFQVLMDLQRVDLFTGAALIGEREKALEVYVDDERLPKEVREGLLGKRVGDTFEVDVSPDGNSPLKGGVGLVETPYGRGEGGRPSRYRITIEEAKRVEMPEIDDEFVREAFQDRFDGVEDMKESIRKELQRKWEERAHKLFNQRMVERMVELHPVAIPEPAVDVLLDSLLEEEKRRVKARNEGRLPDGFDEEAFRQAHRTEAEWQARWTFIREAVIQREGISVTDGDIDAYLEEVTSEHEKVSPEILRRYYEQTGLLDRAVGKLLDRKLLGRLAELFDVEDENLAAIRGQPDFAPGGEAEPLIVPAAG